VLLVRYADKRVAGRVWELEVGEFECQDLGMGYVSRGGCQRDLGVGEWMDSDVTKQCLK
jgi:hypothetical protein